MNLAEIKQYLRDALDNFAFRDSSIAQDTLRQLKQDAVAKNDQSRAKELWCFEQILKIQDKYISAFYQFKSKAYFEGWCSLEQAELALDFIDPHFKEQKGEFLLDFIKKHIGQYQSLFPYKIFLSPEILEIEKICNICNKPISIRNPCGHRVGEIYDGEMCCRIVTKAEFLGTAFVDSPVQKYSVPFLIDPKTGEKKDHYNYSLVRYLVERLQAPFHNWDVKWTKRRHPHSRYKHIGRNDKCPCGSGKKYKKCCLLESGVLRPHCEFTFSVPPPKEMMRIEYTD